MKTFREFISEAHHPRTISYRPKTKAKLKEIIDILLKVNGKNANLNNIHVDLITDMSDLFRNIDFNGDISKWDVSNVTNMEAMFAYSTFNGDISRWDVSNVKDVTDMFYRSGFGGNLDHWDLSSAPDDQWV